MRCRKLGACVGTGDGRSSVTKTRLFLPRLGYGAGRKEVASSATVVLSINVENGAEEPLCLRMWEIWTVTPAKY